MSYTEFNALIPVKSGKGPVRLLFAKLLQTKVEERFNINQRIFVKTLHVD